MRLTRRTLTSLAAPLAAVCLLAACGGSSGSGSTAAGSTGAPDIRIVMLLNDQFDPYYLTLVQGAEAEAEKQGVQFSWQAPTTLDVASQTQLLQSVAATKPAGIIMSALDANAMVAPMKAVQDSGIPIMTVDADVADPSARLGTVRSNGTDTGALAAKAMNDLTGGSGKVGYIGYTPGIQSVDQRLAGWKQGLTTYPGLANAGEQYADAETASNAAKTSALISKTPDLTSIFASWTNATIGAAQAVKQSGKAISVVGVDASPDEVALLKSGAVSALVAQKPGEMGQTAVNDLVAYVKNKTKPQSEKLLDSVVITQAQASDPEYTKYFYATPAKK